MGITGGEGNGVRVGGVTGGGRTGGRGCGSVG